MKVNFLKQIARALVFSLFAAGLPVNLQASSPASSGSSSSASTSSSCPGSVDMSKSSISALQAVPAPQGCQGFSPATCNINGCASSNISSNSPKTFDTSSIKALMGTDYTNTNNAIAAYQNTIQYLLAALSGYTAASANYTQLKILYASLKKLVLDNLYINPCALNPANNSSKNDPLGQCPTTNPTPGGWTPGIMPFTTSNLNVSAYIYPNGDFASIGNLSDAQKGQFMLGFIKYNYNIMPNQSNQIWLLQNLVALILYNTLSKQMNNFAYYAFAWAAFAGQANDDCSLQVSNSDGTIQTVLGEGQESLNPTPQEALTFLKNSACAGYDKLSNTYLPSNNFQFNGGTIAPNILNLLSAISNAQWSQVNTTDLYNVIMGLDLNAVTSTFSTANMQGESSGFLLWVPYLLSAMQALASNNLYFNCSVDMNSGQGIDGSIYYGLNTSQASAKLSDAFVAMQLALIQLSMSKTNTTTNDIATTLPAGLSDFVANYMKGSFYGWLPSSTNSSDGPLALSGLNNGVSDMMVGSLWATACSNSSSSKLASEIATILNQFQLATAQESPIGSLDGSGSPTMPGKTLQGASQNLITAAQAAIKQVPFAAYADTDYSWVNANYPIQQNTSDVLNGANITVTPVILEGFTPQTSADTTAFATQDHLNMLTDITSIMLSYSTCWNNLSFCANNGALGGSATSGATCKASNFFTQKTCAMKGVDLIWETLKEIRQQFNTPFGALMMIFMGYQLLHGFLAPLSAKLTSYMSGQTAADELAAKYKALALNDAGVAAPKQGGGYDIPEGSSAPVVEPPSGDLPSGPGGYGPPQTGTGTEGNNPPVSEQTFAEEAASISSEEANLSDDNASELDSVAEKVLQEEKTVQADQAAGNTETAATEEAQVKEQAEKVKEAAEEAGDADADIGDLGEII